MPAGRSQSIVRSACRVVLRLKTCKRVAHLGQTFWRNEVGSRGHRPISGRAPVNEAKAAWVLIDKITCLQPTRVAHPLAPAVQHP